VQSGLLKPSAEKLSAYSRHVYNIVSGTATEAKGVREVVHLREAGQHKGCRLSGQRIFSWSLNFLMETTTLLN
jgi:hypothetical protein